MLRKIRITVAWVAITLAVLLVLDLSGTLHRWIGWIARAQLLPAILAVNVAALIVVAALTLAFGRIYCSTLCPLGIMQDGISWMAGRRKFRYSKPMTWLRWVVLAIFIVALAAGVGAAVSLLDPWGTFGRIAQNIFAPLWRWGNNLLAWGAARIDSYAFHSVDVYVKSGIALGVAAAWMVGLSVLAWRRGRIYCNSVCPVGTFLGLVSRVSLFRPVIDEGKCTKCGVCEKKCKSECIDAGAGTVDRSRCVVCFDCLDSCNFGAIRYTAPLGSGGIAEAEGDANRRSLGADAAAPAAEEGTSERSGVNSSRHCREDGVVRDDRTPPRQGEGKVILPEPGTRQGSTGKGIDRRKFFSLAALAAAATPAAVKAQQVERILLQVDGGLTDLVDKKRPERTTPITPPGSEDARNMKQHCVACQLCVAACPNNVLVPSSKLATLMQPEMTFEKGYCRPECVECAEVCPTGAIKKITPADKTAISVGNAVWARENCVPIRDQVSCTECERHCPTKAITLIHLNDAEAEKEATWEARGRRGNKPAILKIPTVDTTLCIGCGACENLCPSNPYSAIHVEGHITHHKL